MQDDVKNYLQNLQASICDKLSKVDGKANFLTDQWQRPQGGGGITRVIQKGNVFEQGSVNFSHVMGGGLPPAATLARPDLKDAPFEAMGVSLIMHPNNPYVPTVHANYRFFIATPESGDPVWWFGGGFDLTPYYGFDEDCIFWHQNAKAACDPFGKDLYPKYKQWADDYFFIKHRDEHRGIGGLFFDDINQPSFEQSFAFIQSVGDHFLKGYVPIVEKRKNTPFGERERQFQQLRRGRYVEFNLVYDRGTLFGLQSGGRAQSILVSLPPTVAWNYTATAEPGSLEEKLTEYYLKPRNWVS